jgi:hypothetical protein
MASSVVQVKAMTIDRRWYTPASSRKGWCWLKPTPASTKAIGMPTPVRMEYVIQPYSFMAANPRATTKDAAGKPRNTNMEKRS